MHAPRVCLVITEDWYFWSHRRSLAQHLVQQGCRVDLVTNLSKLESKIRAVGVIPHSIGMQRRGKNPIREGKVIRRMADFFREQQPDIVHLVGMKPILYGSIASRMAKVPATVCAIAGLGWLFTPGNPLKSLARLTVQQYFRFLLSSRSNVRFIVQNTDHRQTLVHRRMANESQVDLIPGAGVDVSRFGYTSPTKETPTVITHGRMLWDKGIGEIVHAARLIKKHDIECNFVLVGDPDPANPASISEQQLRKWDSQGIVQWYGRRDDIPKLLSEAHIACLPSHHEGFPLSLVEASACGRPIVTTDIPGCRDVVDDGKTGLLVPKKDPDKLALALAKLILNAEMRQEMGRRGRQRVVEQMSCKIVNEQTYACYERVLRDCGVERQDRLSPVPAFEREERRAA